MRTLKKYHKELRIIYVPLLITLALIMAFATKLMHVLLFLNGFFFVLLVLVFFSPLKKLQPENKVYFLSYGKAFIKLSLIQLFLALACMNGYVVFIKLMPTQPNISIASILNQNIAESFSWGLFPWSLLLLTGIVIAAYRKLMHRNVTIIDTTYPMIKNKAFGTLGIGIDLFLRQSIVASTSFMMLWFGLSLYFYAIALGAHSFNFSPNGYSITIYLSIFAALSSRYWLHFLRRFWRKNYTTLQLFLIQTCISIVAILALTYFIDWLSYATQGNLEEMLAFPVPHLQFAYALKLLFWTFWMAVTVIIAPLMANLIQDKNIRIMIILGLFWPAMFAVFWFEPSLHLVLEHLILKLDTPQISLLINSVMLVVVGVLFWFNKGVEVQLLNSFYCNKSEKQSRYPLKALGKILRLMSLFLLFYIFNGINLLSIIAFAMIATCYPIFAGIGIGLVKTLWFGMPKIK